MKFGKFTVMLLGMLAAGSTVLAGESEFEMPVMTQETDAAEETDGTAVLSERWDDFQIRIGEEIYQFPMMYGDFVSRGWTSDEVEDVELEPYEYSFFTFEKDGVSCYAYILNLGINTLPASECIVGGMEMDEYGWPLDGEAVTLPGNIVRGTADQAAIEAAYGTPSDVYEGDLYQKLTYEQDYNCSLELYVYKESGVLEEITIENFVEPEGFEKGEVSDEIPETVAAYEKPETLAEEMTAYEIEVAGDVYTLPVPVGVLVSDGWEIVESDSDPYIAAGYYGWVTLRRDNQEFSQTVVNKEKYATVPANCWLEELEVGGYELEMDGALPGGVRIGITEEELLALFVANEIEYEADDSSDLFTYYTYNQLEYDQECTVMIYKDEDGQFPQNTVMSVTCSNAF